MSRPRRTIFHRLTAWLVLLTTLWYFTLGLLPFGLTDPTVPIAKAAAVTWVGLATGNWEDGANWNTGVVPTASDDVTISSSTGNISVTLSAGQTANFASLTIGGDSTYYVTTTLVGNIGTAVSSTIAGRGVLVQKNAVVQTLTGDLTIQSGGILTHEANTTAQSYEVDWSVANLNVQAGGKIDVDGQGYTGTNDTGSSGNGPGGGYKSVSLGTGGAHAGNGGGPSNSEDGPAGYCDITNPVSMGSGGGVGGSGFGGSGGGVIILNVSGTITVNGTITADGATPISGTSVGGGAGGGVKIVAGDIAGTPQSFTITGGGGRSTYGGGGGGGCAFLSYTTANSIFPTSTITMNGGAGVSGQRGGGGVVYVKQTGTNGDIYSVNTAPGAPSAQGATSITADSLTVMVSSTYQIASGKTLVLKNSSPFSGGDASGTLRVDSGGTFTPTSTADFTVASTTLEIHQGSTVTSASSLNVVVDYGGVLSQGRYVTTSPALGLNTLYILNGGVLTHAANTTTQSHVVNLSAASSTVAAGGFINLDGRGYAGVSGGNGNGPGGGAVKVSSTGGGGGAHAGAGGNGFNGSAGGAAYCVTSSPGTIGSSGGYGGNGASPAGGGLAVLAITNTLTVNGTITADGGAAPGSQSTGSGGGGVKITAGVIAGSPQSFTATGSAGRGSSGGGGGGCIYIGYSTSNSISSATVSGGAAGGSGGSTAGGSGEFNAAQTNRAPSAPATLYAHATDAQSGTANPSWVSSITPAFSAIYADDDVGDIANKARIQIGTDSNFSSITHWDSGSSGTSISNCTAGQRCQNIVYGSFGSAPTQNLALNDDADEASQTTYYWRIKFFDDSSTEGAFSAESASFTLLDAPNEPTNLATSSLSITGVTLSWTDNSSLENNYVLQVSEDGGGTYSTASTTVANTTSVTTSTLSADTRYVYRVHGANTAGDSDAIATAAFYTLANAPGTPTPGTVTAATIPITISVNGNPTNTLYAVFDTISDTYVGADGSASAGPVFQTTSTLGNNFARSGLTPNTQHAFAVVARNGDGVSTATSTASAAVYTLAATPSSASASADSASQITVSWNANSNAPGTSYYAEDAGSPTRASGWITATSYTFSGLSAGTAYTFRVKARNDEGTQTDFGSSVTATTLPSGGSPSPTPPAPPPPPSPTPYISAEEIIEFAPTGLIKIISVSGETEVDVLDGAGIAAPHVVNGYSQVKGVSSDDGILDLSSPFSLDFSFALDKTPLDSSLAGKKRRLFSKYDAYNAGYSTNNDIAATKGFCFSAGTGQVCDYRNPFVKSTYVYNIVWSGSTLDLIENNKKLDSAPLAAIPKSQHPLAIGGELVPYQNGKYATSFYPFTLYTLRLKQDPGLLIYTNTPVVKLKIDATYAQQLALKESHGSPYTDFSEVSFNPVVSELTWQLAGEDGKKCVNARFKGIEGKNLTYDTYACVILDRVKPSADFLIDAGPANPTAAAPRIYGVSEPKAVIVITKKSKQAAAALASAAEKATFHLAAEPAAYTTMADNTGAWSYTFSAPFNPGDHIITVQATDPAGNTSDPVSQELSVTTPLPSEPDPEDTKPDEIEDKKEDTKPSDQDQEDTKTDETEKGDEVKKDDTAVADAEEEKTTNPDQADQPVLSLPGEAGPGLAPIARRPDRAAGKEELAPMAEVPESEQAAAAAEMIAPAFGPSLLSQVWNKWRALKDNPFLEKINETAAAPAIALLGAANLAVGVQIPRLLALLRYLFSQPALLLRRRKYKGWGTVYNAYSKLPVDLATIRLISDETNKVVSSQVTDFYGRYFISAENGRFRLEVLKPGFTGFSALLREQTEDAKYLNLYHGEAFYPPESGSAVTYSIPLDPETIIKPTTQILKDHSRSVLQQAFTLVGLGASLVSFAVSPTPGVGFLVGLHVIFYFLFHRLAHRRLPSSWGVVRDLKDKSTLSRVVIRVFDAAYNKLVNTAVTDSRGRYAVLVGPSRYYVMYEKDGYHRKQSPTLDFSSEKTGGLGGIINRSEMMERGTGSPAASESGGPNPGL